MDESLRQPFDGTVADLEEEHTRFVRAADLVEVQNFPDCAAVESKVGLMVVGRSWKRDFGALAHSVQKTAFGQQAERQSHRWYQDGLP